MIYVDFIKQQHMDTFYRYLEYPKYVPQGTCRIEWVKDRQQEAGRALQYQTLFCSY